MLRGDRKEESHQRISAHGERIFDIRMFAASKKRKWFEVTNLRHAETLSIAELFFLYISPSPTMLSFWSCTQNKKKRNSNRVVVISFLSLSLTFFSSLAISQLIGRMPCLLSNQLYTHQGSSPISSPYKGREQEELWRHRISHLSLAFYTARSSHHLGPFLYADSRSLHESTSLLLRQQKSFVCISHCINRSSTQ